MFDGNFRTTIERGMQPVGQGLQRRGVRADHLTAAGLIVAAITAVVIGFGWLQIGLVLLILAALPDLLDGAVAKASGTAGPRGAFFDSVADRATDALLLGGVAWYLASEYGAHAALLPFAVYVASSLVSYERARAESLGLDARGGLMERAERIVLLAFGLLFDALLVPVLWVMLALTLFTVGQRFVKVWRQADAPVPTRVRQRRASRRRTPRPAERSWRSRWADGHRHQ